jgi:formylglycine-generating enzyme required for sulfatase activity
VVSEKISLFTFIAVDGDPPASVALDDLPPMEGVSSVLRTAFSRFETKDAHYEVRYQPLDLPVAAGGLHLIYVYGHTFFQDGTLCLTCRAQDGSAIWTAGAFLRSLLDNIDASHIIIILDCCHAAAFDSLMDSLPRQPRCVIYGSAAHESAIALHGDRATRLCLALARQLEKVDRPSDLISIVLGAAAVLNRDGVVVGQTVSYRMHGPAIQLDPAGTGGLGRRERTVSRIRNLLVGVGSAVALIAVTVTWFYWSHALVDVKLSGLDRIADGIHIVVTDEDPASNGSRVVRDRLVTDGTTRFWLRAGDEIIRVQARYHDHAERALNFHISLAAGFGLRGKLVSLALPLASDVLRHPSMAYIPATKWVHGRDRQARRNDKPFWIDLSPPTVAAYTPVAEDLVRRRVLKIEDSDLLQAQQRSSAVDAVGLGQLRSLNRNLGDIFGVIAQGNSAHVSAPGDVANGLGAVPCAHCPAPMSRNEAIAYCKSQHKRLPTDLEWELAVRGVDGRVYPWGNEFDPSRANVPGLPMKGASAPSLKPVDAYAKFPSPFGLIDTVGNAGDWVIDESGSFETVYMGATYRFNPEDATAFRMLPVTDEDSYITREITARCATDDKAGLSKMSLRSVTMRL